MHCAGVDWLAHITLAEFQSDVTRTSPNLKQKRIVTLIPARTDLQILLRRPISIKLISRVAWAKHGNYQCAEKVRSIN